MPIRAWVSFAFDEVPCPELPLLVTSRNLDSCTGEGEVGLDKSPHTIFSINSSSSGSSIRSEGAGFGSFPSPMECWPSEELKESGSTTTISLINVFIKALWRREERGVYQAFKVSTGSCKVEVEEVRLERWGGGPEGRESLVCAL